MDEPDQAVDPLKGRNWDFRSLLLILLVMSLMVCFYARRIARPFGFNLGYNGAWLGTAARNCLTYGFRATKFAPVVDPGPVSPEAFRFYHRHPALISYLVALSFWSFGDGESQARLVPILLSLASVLLVYRIGSLLWGRNEGVAAATILGLSPMTLF